MNPLNPVLTLILPISLLVGCSIDEVDFGTTEQAVSSQNRLSGNRLSGNGAELGRVGGRRVGVSKRKAVKDQPTIWDGDPVALHELVGSEEGRDLLAYSVKCALPDDERLNVVGGDGIEYSFSGLLGAVPSWTSRDLDKNAQQVLTACLLAHTNFFGVTVPISVRSDNLTATKEEEIAYPVQEAAFFGNLFAIEPTLSSCVGSGIVTDNPTSYLDQRVCAQEVGTSDLTTCGFVAAGACSDTCNSNHGAFKDCVVNGVKYHDAITVYLMP